MPRVEQVIRHIRKHVLAESSDSDPSQVSGVDRRAQLVLDAIQSLRNDSRDLSLRDLLTDIHNLIPTRQGRASFRRTITNMRDSGETRVQLAIQNWVGKARETR